MHVHPQGISHIHTHTHTHTHLHSRLLYRSLLCNLNGE
jgi:hypothetical protein